MAISVVVIQHDMIRSTCLTAIHAVVMLVSLTGDNMTGDLYAELGAAIRERRIALGLSQAELGERADLKRTSVTMIELGSQAVLVHQLIALAKALKLTPDKLLSAVEKQEQPGPSRDLFEAAEMHGLLNSLSEPLPRITR